MESQRVGSGPCVFALALARVPAKRWNTRADVLAALAKAKAAIDACPSEPLPLCDAARVAGFSPHHFQRLFKRVYGRSPHAYRSERRLGLARSMLRERGVTVSEACVEAGFSSASSFAKLYYRRYGRLPRADRGRPAKSQVSTSAPSGDSPQ